MFFDRIEAAPPDPILGLTDAFKKDTNPQKINLGAGVYQNDEGATPVLDCVKAAERQLLEHEHSKSYLPIPGLEIYGQHVRDLLFGPDHPLAEDGRCVTCHCPGGTGALRIGADFIRQQNVAATVWISDPTWANHLQIMAAAGLKVERYPYYDGARHALNFGRMLETLGRAQPGDIVLLHACCHNPTGVDLTAEQWEELGHFLVEHRLMPFMDFAYQGFAAGIDEDAHGVRTIARHCHEMLIASSFSKNFSLYNERVGALTVLAEDYQVANRLFSQLKITVRSSFSNPPAHGEKIVNTVLSSPELRRRWEEELTAMRERIRRMRVLLSEQLRDAGAGDFSFITEQNGMFSFSGLNPQQVQTLKSEYGIYIVGSGRICVACINEGNVGRLAECMARVIRG